MVAEEAPHDVREQAFNLCQLHAEACENAALIGQCRDIVGYDYWKAVCAVGSSEAMGEFLPLPIASPDATITQPTGTSPASPASRARFRAARSQYSSSRVCTLSA